MPQPFPIPTCDCVALPPPTGCSSSVTPDPTSCGGIKMFFGALIPESSSQPGELQAIYSTGADNKFGFAIGNFVPRELINSNLFPGDMGADFVFDLTEAELLASATYDGWQQYCRMWSAQAQTSNFDPAKGPAKPLGSYCMEFLKLDAGDGITLYNALTALRAGDTSGIKSFVEKLFAPFNDPDRAACDQIEAGIKLEKMKIAWEYINNLYKEYYGKQFLVKVSASPGASGTPSNVGVCVRDEAGHAPAMTKPYFIDGDGSSQGFHSSDEIITAGFPKKGSGAGDLLGVSRLDWIQHENGEVEPFVSMGAFKDTTTKTCPEYNRAIYEKFILTGTERVKWGIDLSALNSDSYYIDGDNLFVKCSVESKLYYDDDGTWAHIILQDRVPLSAIDYNPMLGIYLWTYIIGFEWADIFAETLNRKNTSSGALNNTSQLNLLQGSQPCLFPEGAVIPFKSNVYHYGPYYYVPPPPSLSFQYESSGVEVVIDTQIAPWNFMPSTAADVFPVNYPYCMMDNYGKEIAKASVKGVQQLEKGRINVVGFPCYDLGKYVDSGVTASGVVGPTLLTDMNVEYGSSGFNTTYNFSTYTPRLGKPQKYITDALSEDMRRRQYINNYLKAEKSKVEQINKRFIKGRIDNNLYFTLPVPPVVTSKTTPGKLLFSGYYFNKASGVPSTTAYDAPVPPSGDLKCTASGTVPPSGTPPSGVTTDRIYGFAETHEGFTSIHVQNTYYQLAGMSLDGSYLPVSLKGAGSGTTPEYNTSDGNIITFNIGWENAGRLPRFSKRCLFDDTFIEWESTNDKDTDVAPGIPIKSKTRDEIPPFKIKTGDKTAYCLPINQRYLNPYLSEQILAGGEAGRVGGTLLGWDERKSDSDKGFVIGSIVFGSDFKNYQVTHTTPEDLADFTAKVPGAVGKFADKDTDEFIRQQYCNFRVPAFRGPMVLQGWGYDTTGKPIPNAADTSAHAIMGEFRQGALSDKFMKNWIQNPKTWPVGPIDLRFDRERGVWTCPSPNKIIVARLTEDLKCGGKAKAELINPVAGDIHFYEKYHISGPNGENIKTQMFDTEIMVYDFLGLELDKCSKVYVYYDDNRYIVLNSETPDLMVRFRVIKLCDTDAEDPYPPPPPPPGSSSSSSLKISWGEFAGYGDKYSNQHTYGIRIDCDGNPIDINGKPPAVQLTKIFLTSPDNVAKWLIKLQDNAGKFGPSYAHFSTDKYQEWITNGATGYGAKIQSKTHSGSSNSALLCTLGSVGDCELEAAYLANTVLPTYDIIFIESYARFIHGCLTQDLYPSGGSSTYEGDLYKKDHLDGNASVDITHWYGDSPNGKEPIYLDATYQTLPIRVFDPWLKDDDDSEISCYKKNESIFYTASSGTAFTAIFNEKEKKYYLWQINKKESPTIRFKLIDMCYRDKSTDENIKNPNYDTSITCSGSADDSSMDWVKYAGYGDKFPNDHSMGVRINCDGIPVDNKGKILTRQDLIDPNQAKCIFVNILDTVGFHGPAFSTLIRQSDASGTVVQTSFDSWIDKAFTGFATKCDPAAAGNCALGRYNTSTPRTTCFPASADYPAYEILFLENYARFVECELTQPLYIEDGEDESCVEDDDYKKEHLTGNASANILGCYGNSPNGKAPIFKDESFQDVEFRVFDPFMDAPKEKNPFYKLRYGDRVLAIFDESKKKYIIYQSLKYPDDSIVKFALYQDKDVNDAIVSAVLVDACGVPIDIKGQPLTSSNFSDNTIMVNDPFVHRTDYCGKGITTGDLTAFGPALGSDVLNEHLNGIVLGDGYGPKGVAPFLGFAMKRTIYESESGNCNSINNTGNVVYEMFQLERFAAYVNGKITTKTASYADPNGVNGKFYYLGARPQPQGYTDGICPIARGTAALPRGDLIVDHTTLQFKGVHSIIIGDEIDAPNSGNDFQNHDGCLFIAKLDNVRCKKINGKINHLIYYIVEAERVALAGVLQFTAQDHANSLNGGTTTLGAGGESPPNTAFGQGFMWDRTKSKTNFDLTNIFNASGWVNQGMLLAKGDSTKGSIISLTLGVVSFSEENLNNDSRAAVDANGNLSFSVVNAGTIAQVLQKGVGTVLPSPGIFGSPTGDEERKIRSTDTFFHGLSAKDIDEGVLPSIKRIEDQQWMTYEGARLTALWDETTNKDIDKNSYKIVYVQEAPIIITGVATANFTPKTADGITIQEDNLACGMGVDANPMPDLLTKVANPMGYGALKDDLVTIQRVWTASPANNANYRYIIIGTGKPPG